MGLGNNKPNPMKALFPKGRVVSVNLEVVDSSKADKLLSSMYVEKVQAELGVIVNSWHVRDTLRAQELRLEMLRIANDKYNTEVSNILATSDEQLLTLNKGK